VEGGIPGAPAQSLTTQNTRAVLLPYMNVAKRYKKKKKHKKSEMIKNPFIKKMLIDGFVGKIW